MSTGSAPEEQGTSQPWVKCHGRNAEFWCSICIKSRQTITCHPASPCTASSGAASKALFQYWASPVCLSAHGTWLWNHRMLCGTKCGAPRNTEQTQSSRAAAAVSVQHSTQGSKALLDHKHSLPYSCTALNQLLCMKELSLYLQKQLPKILWVPALMLVLSKPQNVLISKSLWLLFRKCSWWCPIDSVLC